MEWMPIEESFLWDDIPCQYRSDKPEMPPSYSKLRNCGHSEEECERIRSAWKPHIKIPHRFVWRELPYHHQGIIAELIAKTHLIDRGYAVRRVGGIKSDNDITTEGVAQPMRAVTDYIERRCACGDKLDLLCGQELKSMLDPLRKAYDGAWKAKRWKRAFAILDRMKEIGSDWEKQHRSLYDELRPTEKEQCDMDRERTEAIESNLKIGAYCSNNAPYDFFAEKDGHAYYVEVKSKYYTGSKDVYFEFGRQYEFLTQNKEDVLIVVVLVNDKNKARCSIHTMDDLDVVGYKKKRGVRVLALRRISNICSATRLQ